MASASTAAPSSSQGHHHALAAFAASTLYTVSTYPFHRVKVLIQTQDANPAVLAGTTRRFRFFSAFGRLLREHGGSPSGLWHGATPYLLRHIPSVSISFAAKDAFRDLLLPPVLVPSRPGEGDAAGAGAADRRPRRRRRRPPAVPVLAANACAGGLAGALALAVVYPFELLTIRMAADVGGGGRGRTTRNATPSPPSWQYGSTPYDAAKRAVARDGLRGLYRGFGVAVSSAACYKALYFGLHDWAKEFLFDGKYSDGGRRYGVFGGGGGGEKGGGGEDGGGGEKGGDRPPSPSSPSTFIRTILERLSIASGTTVVAATLTHPLDVVRKRLVVDLRGELYGGTFRGAVAGIWRREGLRGFLRFLPQDALLRSGAGTILVTYDMLLSGGGGVFGGREGGGGRGGARARTSV
jgi:solute carrier family 25 (mitochondrial adenine nucleotide translocator), member 4/5/6/31